MNQPTELQREIEKRRTFAIISHPDAGKTTLTEKLLLYGGVVHLAGAVKAKRGRANAVSDWMEMERERGISITTSVLQFEYEGLQLNLLDTPGHADFSEDTYRTLHAVDGAVMLLDAAKGVESQTRKLFRVCRQRSIPVFTFVNKMDRPCREPFELVGEVESVLGIGVYPVTWPVFRSGVFMGVYHRRLDQLMLFDAARAGSSAAQGSSIVVPMKIGDMSDPELRELLGREGCNQVEQDVALLNDAGDAFDQQAFFDGRLSPMFFGSAINNFGLEMFLDSFIHMMPAPLPRMANTGSVEPASPEFSGFVFKIQANMNPAHRDRVAFVRICSGRYQRKTKVLHVRTQREVRLANPTQFVARERTLVDEAFAGDVIGVYDPGFFQVGDTLTGGTVFEYEPIPSFAPEYFRRLVMIDPLRRKQLVRGTTQLAQEGTVQLYQPPDIRTGEMILGAVGVLQLEVAKFRLTSEYGVDVRLETAPVRLARWITRVDGLPVDFSDVRQNIDAMLVVDVRNRPVVLFEAEWNLNSAIKFHPEYEFAETAQGVIVRDPGQNH